MYVCFGCLKRKRPNHVVCVYVCMYVSCVRMYNSGALEESARSLSCVSMYVCMYVWMYDSGVLEESSLTMLCVCMYVGM